MAHQAIYRKWRPMVFEDIIGQTHITRTLKNQIINDRIGHAYLFCGTRGTGKTTCAKVFSRAVNCLNPHDGSPCNECEICRGIIDGSITDVTELDAASNRKIDDIREIISDVAYVASSAKYTVYIIDEVHMLTTEAFNALLKTLEEPPEHVIFILATTDPQKVPQTILSRCQRFDFKRISISDIVVRMKEIAYGDGLTLTEDAYHLIARLGDGSMRDALSVMERVVSACGENITADDIIDILGISAQDTLFDMTDAIIGGQPDKIISIIDRLMSDGRDLNTFTDSLLQHFRDLMMCRISAGSDSLLNYSSEDAIKLKTQSSKLTFEKITRAVHILSEAKADAKWVKAPRIIYELALIKLARPETDSSPEALVERLKEMESSIEAGRDEKVYARLDAIEEKLKNGIVAAEKPEEEEHIPKPKPVSKRLYNPIPKSELTADNPIVITAKKWDHISSSIIKKAGYLYAPLANRPITIDRDGIILLFKRSESATLGILNANKNKLMELFARFSGTDCAIKYAYRDEIGDNDIDIWSLKPSESMSNDMPAEVENKDGTEVMPENVPITSQDPIERLSADFPEIVEITDGQDFVGYDKDDDKFSQTSFDGDDDSDREEFLESGELQDEEE